MCSFDTRKPEHKTDLGLLRTEYFWRKRTDRLGSSHSYMRMLDDMSVSKVRAFA